MGILQMHHFLVSPRNIHNSYLLSSLLLAGWIMLWGFALFISFVYMWSNGWRSLRLQCFELSWCTDLRHIRKCCLSSWENCWTIFYPLCLILHRWHKHNVTFWCSTIVTFLWRSRSYHTILLLVSKSTSEGASKLKNTHLLPPSPHTCNCRELFFQLNISSRAYQVRSSALGMDTKKYKE